MSRDDGMNMSVRATGNIVASGYNNNVNTNFVTDCFAKDLNLSMAVNNNFSLANTTYQARFQDFNSTNSLIYDSNATDINTAQLGLNLINIQDGNFTKSTAGSLSTITRLNYDRNQTQPLNSIMDRFSSMGIKCVIPSECTMQADLSGSHEANGSRAMDFNVTHVYGRIIPRDIRVFGANTPFVANAWYEVYNSSTLNGVPLQASKNESMWYINGLHNDRMMEMEM